MMDDRNDWANLDTKGKLILVLKWLSVPVGIFLFFQFYEYIYLFVYGWPQ